MNKVYTRLQTEKGQKLYPFGGVIYLYGLYRGVPSGRKSKYLYNFVRGPGCPLNASIGLNWFEAQTVQRYVNKNLDDSRQ